MRAPSQRTIWRSIALASAAMLAACGEKAPEQPEVIRPVLFTEAKAIRSDVFGPFIASIEPRYQSQLGFRASGRIVTRDASVGDLVRKGDRLASLDPSILRFAVMQAQAAVVNAEAQLKNAAAVEERKRILIRTGAVPQSALDAAVSDKRTALARLEQARAQLEKAEDQLGYSELKAEFDGVVIAWSAEVGQVVTEGTSVVSIAQPDVREAVVDIPDDLIGKVGPDVVFRVALQASTSVTADGRLREIAPSADPSTRTRRVRLMLDKPSEAFRLGSTAAVSFATPAPERYEIPASALLERDGHTFLWTIPPDAAAVTLSAVSVSRRDGRTATITSGLRDGDRIVTAGVNRLREGQAVKVPPAPVGQRTMALKTTIPEGSP